MSKHLELNDAPVASPLRRKSLAARTPIRVNNLPIQDNEAELLARRRRESAIITSDNRRQSFGITYISQLNNDQLQKKCLECVQLNIDNKISMKNAFSVPAIDMLTYFVKENSNPDLQIASSTLDVSSKVYGLRVDKVYMEVNKLCTNMGQKNVGNEEMEEQPVEMQDEENKNLEQAQKKKKRAKRTNVFASVEALRGNVETISLESLISGQDDPQTSDVLNQVQVLLSTKDGCYMKNFGGPVLDDLEGLTARTCALPNPIIEQSSISFRQPLSFPFSFLNCNDDTDSDPEMSFDQEMDVDPQQQADIFHFDINEVPDPTPFPSQEPTEVQVQNKRAQEPGPFIVDFHDIINSQITHRESEYSFVPLNLIKFSGPAYWKIAKRRETSVIVNKERCKATKKKEIVLDYMDDTESVNTGFQAGTRTKMTESTQCAWTEENNCFYNYNDKFVDLEMFSSFAQEDHQFKKIRRADTNVAEQNVAPEINSDHEDNFAAMNDDMDFQNRSDDADHHFENPPAVENHTEETEVGRLSQGQFIGDNLVSAPDVVDNIFIPYSKRAKKINVRQVKQSMIKLLLEKFEDDENSAPNAEETGYKFSELYQSLPRLLSRSNADAMSVPIAFVSLLHLANEQTLAIDSDTLFQDLNIKSDEKEHNVKSRSN